MSGKRERTCVERAVPTPPQGGWEEKTSLTYQILSRSVQPQKVGLLAYKPVVKGLLAYKPVVKSPMANKPSQGVLSRTRSRIGHFHPRNNVNRCGMDA